MLLVCGMLKGLEHPLMGVHPSDPDEVDVVQ
jgi:hypothetical protein